MAKDRRSERGYILLMLMLFVTLLAIAAAAVAPSIAFRVRRDREEEMIHRGVQYSRAIRRYVKKTGRYPSRLEDLENTNNIRFLRKRYKDPITGKDFKILQTGDVQLMGAAGIAGAVSVAGGMVPGASPLGGATAAGGPAAAAAASMLMGAAAGQRGSTAAATAATDGVGDNSAQGSGPVSAGTPDPSSGQSTDASQGQDQSKNGQTGLSASSEKLSSTVFGGGPIVGVASISKAQTIREFNHKNHYNQWQFIYDPTMDRGGLITTPAQPPLQVSATVQQQNSAGQNSSIPGASGFGTSSSNGPQSAQPDQPAQQQQQ